jgi:hypothetical protein
MKKIFYSIIATVLLLNLSYGQTSNSDWTNMMENYRNLVENILSKECPKGMDIDKFKTSLIKGEMELSESNQEIILSYTEPLKRYGLEFANKNKLKSLEESDLIFYSSISPDIPVENGEILAAKVGTPGLTWADVGNCALAALGADALYSLAFSGASSWSVAALTTTFSGVAKRFLGPIGVAIAVTTFGLCLADAYAN